MEKKKKIFLLGGKDLEMLTIKEILKQKGFDEDESLFDRSLGWGAKLSAYKEELERFSKADIYGIELIEDISPPANYHRIDHHNDLSDNEASIIQVLKLLEIEPTREHLLIAQNDIGHIEAMRRINAKPEEIEDIRKRDRAAQGVTQTEETDAPKEIEKIKQERDIYILKTRLEHFSPIVDRFDKRPFLIYNGRNLTYFGETEKLKEHYKELIEKQEAYHGRGFFGFDGGYLATIDIEAKVKEMLDVLHDTLFSHHQFMFPFRFDKITESFEDKHEYYREVDFDKRVVIDKKLRQSLKESGWKYEPFEVKNHLDYNEIVYYYDFVKDALFNTQGFKKGATSYFFEKTLEKDAFFEINIKGKESYTLDLTGITLRLFDTGVGILSFEMENRKYQQIDDILKINEYGRRIYPQFLGDGFDVEKTKETFLPESVKVNGIEERFCDIYKEIRPAKYILEVLGESFSIDKTKIEAYYLQPIIDDRMFVLCWYGNDAFADCVQQENIMYNDWYRYVFVDGGGLTVQDSEMHKALITESTYSRWKNYGTFYGITRYSFVCLSQNNEFTKSVLPLPHMKTMYFQMVTLLLAQRASLLRFSDEITAISDIRSQGPSTEKIAILYKNYLRFVNKLYFKEVTAQDQGIELYDKAIDILNIKRDVEDLRQEIMALNSYAFLEQEKEEKEQMGKLTKLGTYLLPPTLIAGILGMNVFSKQTIDINSNWWGISAFFVFSFLSVLIMKYFIKDKK